MANVLRESYNRGSKGKTKMGDMHLERVTIREADNDGFVVECFYESEPKKKKEGEMMQHHMYEDKTKVFANAVQLLDFLEDIYGD